MVATGPPAATRSSRSRRPGELRETPEVSVSFLLNGVEVTVPDGPSGARPSLLDVLRGHCGITSAKDGCAPQGQCGCCTVWIDGQPRVSCVTPLGRVAGRSVTTLEGLQEELARSWAASMSAEGGSQCGFCTPGIIMRLEAGRVGAASGAVGTRQTTEVLQRSLAAHLCRCTGWQGIVRAAEAMHGGGTAALEARPGDGAATARATLETGGPQLAGPEVALGRAGFAADTAPADALVALLDPAGRWVVAETLADARTKAQKVQGRRSSVEARPPLEVPDGDWDAELSTSWVEPAYLETDAAWCAPGGEPKGPLANGGAFGAKAQSPLPEVARALAAETGRTVLALYSREDCVRLGPKRPPVAGGMRRDGSGLIRVVTTEGIADAIALAAPDLLVEQIAVPGPPTSTTIRCAGWLEAFCLSVAAGAASPLGGRDGDATRAQTPGGGWARVEVLPDVVEVTVGAGDPLDEAVLRSYVEGAVHMALGLVTSEAIAVDEDGAVCDLTVRSFGILGTADMPRVRLAVDGVDGPPVPVGDSVFAATAAAVWLARGAPRRWPLSTPPLR